MNNRINKSIILKIKDNDSIKYYSFNTTLTFSELNHISNNPNSNSIFYISKNNTYTPITKPKYKGGR